MATGAFLEELDTAVACVATAPDAYPAFIEDTRRYVFPRFPFNLVYRIDGEAIVVIAVSHQRRLPRYWEDRGI